MTKMRHVARMLVRLVLPVIVLCSIGSTPGSASGRPQNGCTYGLYYEYYDENGNICATSETCNNTHWGDCDETFTFSSYQEYLQLCYCDL